MQPDTINSAVIHCIEHSNGSVDAAEAFIACLRTDDAWSDEGIAMVEYLALPIVSEPLTFHTFAIQRGLSPSET